MATKVFTISDLTPISFKGIAAKPKAGGRAILIPSGAVFPSGLKEDRLKTVDVDAFEKQIKTRDILFNTGGVGTLGRSSYFSLKGGVYIPDSFVMVLRFENKNILPKYVFYCLQSSAVKSQVTQKTSGTTGITSIKPKDILSLKIPLPVDSHGNPDMKEQNRIVTLLEEAECLKKKRAEADEKMTKVIPALFNQMFGDPINNNRGWKRDRIGDFANVVTGNTPPRAIKSYYGSDIEWIKSDNIFENEIYPTKARECLSLAGAEKGRTTGPNSILMTCIAGSLNTIGNVCLTDRLVAFNQQINAIELDKKTNPIFLYALLKNSKRQLHRSASHVLKHIINKTSLENVEVIRPPLELQNEFAEKVKEILDIKIKQKKSSEHIDYMFSSLLAKI